VLVHLEHADLVLATEHHLELLIRHDLALVLRVLELVLLDVLSNLAHHLWRWQGERAHNGCQLLRGLKRLHQSGIRLRSVLRPYHCETPLLRPLGVCKGSIGPHVDDLGSSP